VPKKHTCNDDANPGIDSKQVPNESEFFQGNKPNLGSNCIEQKSIQKKGQPLKNNGTVSHNLPNEQFMKTTEIDNIDVNFHDKHTGRIV